MAAKKAPPAQEQPPEQAAEAPAETAAQAQTAEKPTVPTKPAPEKKGSGGWVMATLKTRHCDGGVCKEAGEQMRLTRGSYERLKKYGRVE